MSRTVFQANYLIGSMYVSNDHDTVEAAIADVQDHASLGGSITRFRVERNLPHCLPEFVYRSSALWQFDGDVWNRQAIFDGTGGTLRQEVPNNN